MFADIGNAEVRSMSLAGLLLMFPCHVQKKIRHVG